MGCTLPRAPAVKALSEGSEGQQQGSFSGCLAAQTKLRTESTRFLQQVLPQGLLPLSWGCGQEPRQAVSGPNLLHMSLLGRRVLGKLPLSYTFWAPTESASGSVGLQNPARDPWNLVLSVRRLVWVAKQPLKEPCCCPSLPSDRAFTAGALGSVQPTSP